MGYTMPFDLFRTIKYVRLLLRFYIFHILLAFSEGAVQVSLSSGIDEVHFWVRDKQNKQLVCDGDEFIWLLPLATYQAPQL